MKKPSEIIDIHSHVFNLKYLPISGTLKAYLPKITPLFLIRGVAFILNKMTKSSDLESENKMGGLNNLSPYFTDELLLMKYEDILDDIAVRAAFDDEIFEEEVVIKALDSIDNEDDWKLGNSSFIEAFEKAKLDKDDFFGWKKRLIKKLLKKVLSDKFPQLKWFRFMLRNEKHIYENLLNDNREVTRFVFHMMDGDLFFKLKKKKYSKARYSIETKTLKMKSLIEYSDNKLIGFVAFNPKREDSLEIVKDAILNKGFKGVKFYPPMGYKPFGNDDNSVENKVLELFRWCIVEDIPVFTHCTPTGYEASPRRNTGKNANPKFWKELLNQSEFNSLRLCLGHAGGEEGWKSNFTADDVFPEDSFAKIVYELCVNHPNVYCEVGFLGHIYNHHDLNIFVERLLKLFKNKETSYEFSKKVCYGSDYHILFKEGLHKSYLNKFLEIFASDNFDDFREDFFHLNAKSYLFPIRNA